MGYTHYWTFKSIKRGATKHTNANYAKAIAACQRIVRTYNLGRVDETRLAGVTAHTEPGSYAGVTFNGTGDLSHEPFILRDYFNHNSASNFCKTARKPYNVVVVACLVVLKHFLKDQVTVSSDGNAQDWHDGLLLAQKILKNKTLKNPIGTIYKIGA
jgi:hypothetical protein